ncbi:SWIM zinc finger family protein [Pyramidobacter piscolens]|uniref:SWIM zinc finger family protein n=1 Tax=Pyramidobacter piscolens TaxID=638849 RepID=UPI002AB2D875|nr:SWIM zinc finger family protein [Pyramidobacter piscolens]
MFDVAMTSILFGLIALGSSLLGGAIRLFFKKGLEKETCIQLFIAGILAILGGSFASDAAKEAQPATGKYLISLSPVFVAIFILAIGYLKRSQHAVSTPPIKQEKPHDEDVAEAVVDATTASALSKAEHLIDEARQEARRIEHESEIKAQKRLQDAQKQAEAVIRDAHAKAEKIPVDTPQEKLKNRDDVPAPSDTDSSRSVPLTPSEQYREDMKQLKEWRAQGKDINQHPLQIERMKRAVEIRRSILSFDEVNKRATFVGRKGEVYETTLESCTCMDFIRRGFPCKHMYCLFQRLGIMSIEQIDPQVKDRTETIEKILNSLSSDEQYELYRLLCYWVSHGDEAGWSYKRDEPISSKLCSLHLLEEKADVPFLLESHIQMSEIRRQIRLTGTRSPQKRSEALQVAAKVLPKLVEDLLKDYRILAFSDWVRPIRGKLKKRLYELTGGIQYEEVEPGSYAYQTKGIHSS